VPGTNQNDQVLTCLTSREHDYAENTKVVSDSILEHPNRSGYLRPIPQIRIRTPCGTDPGRITWQRGVGPVSPDTG
jgi:hypothetical protein